MHLLAVCVVALVFGFVGSMPLAGPIAVMTISRAARGRYGEALRVGLGAAVAEGLYAALAFWGFTHLLGRSALVVPLSSAATALVLLPLGVRFMFWRADEERDHRESKAGTALLGFSVSALNPTLFVSWSAAVAFLYGALLQNPSEGDAIPFGLCAATGIASWFLVLVGLLRRFEGKFGRGMLGWAVRALGLALFGIGVWSSVRLVAWLVHRREASHSVPAPAVEEGSAPLRPLTCNPASSWSWRSPSRAGHWTDTARTGPRCRTPDRPSGPTSCCTGRG